MQFDSTSHITNTPPNNNGLRNTFFSIATLATLAAPLAINQEAHAANQDSASKANIIVEPIQAVTEAKMPQLTTTINYAVENSNLATTIPQLPKDSLAANTANPVAVEGTTILRNNSDPTIKTQPELMASAWQAASLFSQFLNDGSVTAEEKLTLCLAWENGTLARDIHKLHYKDPYMSVGNQVIKRFFLKYPYLNNTYLESLSGVIDRLGPECRPLLRSLKRSPVQQPSNGSFTIPNIKFPPIPIQLPVWDPNSLQTIIKTYLRYQPNTVFNGTVPAGTFRGRDGFIYVPQ